MLAPLLVVLAAGLYHFPDWKGRKMELVLKLGEVVCLKDTEGKEIATIVLVDDPERRGVFLVVKPREAAIDTRFRHKKHG